MPDAAVDGDRRTTAVARPPLALVMLAFSGLTVGLSLLVGLVSADLERGEPMLGGPGWLDGWYQMDSGWYHAIATVGYSYVPGQQSSIAFFPTYPMAVRLLGAAIGDEQLAGSLLSVGCGAAFVALFARWAWSRLHREAALLAVALLLLYPYALYLYGAMYGESVFMLTALGAFLLLERRQYWLAGLVGALATAGRPVGVAVAVGLVVGTLEQLARDRRTSTDRTGLEKAGKADGPGRPTLRDLLGAVPAVRWRQAGVLLSAAGLVGWCWYLWVTFGDPLAWISVQAAPGWYQGSGPRTWFKIMYLGALVVGTPQLAAILTAQAVFCLLAILLLPRVLRTFGWGYAAYAAVVLGIVIVGTKDFMGAGRYVLVAFPVIAAGGAFLAGARRRWVRWAVLGVFALGLLTATSLYARGIAIS